MAKREGILKRFEGLEQKVTLILRRPSSEVQGLITPVSELGPTKINAIKLSWGAATKDVSEIGL